MMIKFLFSLLVCYGAIMLALYVFQRKLLYIPDTTIYPPHQYGLQGFSDLSVITKDGVRIQFWHKAAKEGFPTVAYFHGNAANLGNRAASYQSFVDKGFGILALSYRGYGSSEGSPSEQGIYNDARAMFHYAKETLGLKINELIYYGESLGSGVAIQMATEQPPGAVVLEAPYTSVAGRAAEIYFYAPVWLLIKDRFDSIKKIDQVHSPLLILHGEMDSVIPISHGKALLKKANQPKKAIFFPDRGHNDFDRNVISTHVLDFAKIHGLIPQ